MSLYHEMVEVAEKLHGQSKGKYLSNYSEDLYEYDKDLIHNHFDSGSCLIWIIKGNGCGTELLEAREEFAKTMLDLDTKEKENRYFQIEVTGPNQGNIQPVSLEKAQSLTRNMQGEEAPKPRRQNLYASIPKKLGHYSGTKLQGALGSIAQDLMPTANEPIYLRVQQDPGGLGGAQVTMAKPSLKKDPKGISRTKKQTATSSAPPAPGLTTNQMSNPLHLKITPHNNPTYADIEVATKQQFHRALKKGQEREAGPSMQC